MRVPNLININKEDKGAEGLLLLHLSLPLNNRMLLLQLPPLQSLKLSSNFINGSSPIHILKKPSSSLSLSPPSFLPQIQAMKTLQGRVVCSTNDKTVAVEVVRLAPHPKYKRRVRKKKKYQAHDPENQFKVGDMVQLERSKPISKTKAFVAIAVPPRKGSQPKEAAQQQELGIPLESQQVEKGSKPKEAGKQQEVGIGV